jgi:N-acetylglucosamine-6-phosphate deacetylase
MVSEKTIKFGRLISGLRTYENGYINIQNGMVKSIGKSNPEAETADFSDFILVPGLIDIHTHGYFGMDSYNSTDDEILEWAKNITRTGVTSFIPTLVSLPINSIEGQFQRYRKLLLNRDPQGARILGLRCEGPYISKEKMGAHNPNYLRTPDINELDSLFRSGEGILKIIDMAPEIGDMEKIAMLSNKYGIKISIGHTNTDYKTVKNAIDLGAPLMTHFYNAMSDMGHRDVGAVGAGLLSDTVQVELIADLHHVSQEAIEILIRMRGLEHVVLVTDSLSIGGSNKPEFELGGLPVVLKDGVAWIKGKGVIAGSVLTMDQALRNMVGMGYDLQKVIYSTSTLQADILGLRELGKLEPGYVADICVLDSDLEVVATICRGNIVYKSTG